MLGVLGLLGGIRGVRGVLGASSEWRYSGARRGIGGISRHCGAARGVGATRGAIKGCQECIGGWQGV